MPVTITQEWYEFDELGAEARKRAARALGRYLDDIDWYEPKRERMRASLDAFMKSISCEYSAAGGSLDWIRPSTGDREYWPFDSAYADCDELDPKEVLTLPCAGDDDDALIYALPIEARSDGHPVGNALAKAWAEIHDSAISAATAMNRRLAGEAQDGLAGVRLAADLRLFMTGIGARHRTWLAEEVGKALDEIDEQCDPLSDEHLDPEYASSVPCADGRFLFSSDGRQIHDNGR